MGFDEICFNCGNYSGIKNAPNDTDRQQETKLIAESSSGSIIGESMFVLRPLYSCFTSFPSVT